MPNKKYYMGIDLGSVSLNIVVIDEASDIKAVMYRRIDGRPLVVLRNSLEDLATDFNSFHRIIVTGSGRKLVGKILEVPDVNEIVTQAAATCHYYPTARTIIEIGGQDSKLIFLDRDEESGKPFVVDHVLNEVCAAGTGSFLDLQAERLGITIEDLGALAVRSNHPARISGRCSVFAKSDMVHLQQEGTPKSDIVAGLCFALARNFITNLGKGKAFPKPIVFQGGVAANPGVVKAFEHLLDLGPGALIIPEHFLIMGALGSALMAIKQRSGRVMPLKHLIQSVQAAMERAQDRPRATHLKPLTVAKAYEETTDHYYAIEPGDHIEAFLGVDVGAVSTNIVLVDTEGYLVAKQYWYTRGEAVETVRAGLEEMAQRVPGVRVCGVGVTGSGRYFIGDFVGADVVINEISAQARAALHLDRDVDTILEIGGQDSKYIRCEQGRVLDFEMNKVCAAGTGSFLEEQAARLKVPIRGAFSDSAFASKTPADLGARCTVFMESDLIHHQQVGYSLSDLTAGLSYAIAHNYLEKVVGTRKIGRRIVFQGGVAANQSVVTAFENILGKPLTVSDHHNVTGAIGAALAARDSSPASTRFAGFHLKDRPYEVKTFECQKCPNVCRVHQIYIEDRLCSYYGSLCGRYEKGSDRTLYSHLPDLFQERDIRLMGGFDEETEAGRKGSGPVVGIPRTLTFYEYFPFWYTFFNTLGHPVVVSDKTNKTLVQDGLSYVPSETCYPVKTVYGHMSNLMSKGAERVLLACEVDHSQPTDQGLRSFNCPYIQSMPYMVRAAMGTKVKLLAPILRWSRPRHETDRTLMVLGRSLGHASRKIKEALGAAHEAQHRFDQWRRIRGREILASLEADQQALVLLGKCHNIYDEGLNLHLVRKLRRTGHLPIPYDMLPIADISLPAHYENVVWKNTRDLMKALVLMRVDTRLFPVLLTNFGCGPDSFFMKYMEAEIGSKPYVTLEVDEHTGDAGMITRIEAFLDTIGVPPRQPKPLPRRLNLVIKGRPRAVDPWNPDPDFMKRLENRVLYFPHASLAFSAVVQASFEAIGLQAQVLPKPDDETEYLGRKVTSSRECHPFIVTCGDFVKMTQQLGFDPERTAVWIPSYDGACRFTQYGIGYADLFRRLGLSQISVIAPLTSTRFDELAGLFGLRYTKLLWQGWMATEVLERLRLHTRPYEKRPGETDRIFESGIKDIAQAIVQPNGKLSWQNRNVLSALTRAVKALGAVPVDRSQKRPTIGIVGEFYTVLNRRANQDLIRTLEALGAEVRIHGLTVTNCFTLFSQHYYARNRLKERKLSAALYYFLRNRWLMSWVERAESCMPEELRAFGTLDTRTILDEVAPFIYYDIDPILATFTTRVRQFAASGICGICNLFVLNCMLGNVTVSIFKNALRDYRNLPVLHGIYDGQKETNMLTRIEAFMHQARLYQQRFRETGKAPKVG